MLRRNVLIFHSGALGDFILSWPLSMALGRLFPQSRIVCVCAAQKGKLFETALKLESSDVENGWGRLFVAGASPAEPVLRMLSGAHTICSFVADAHSAWAENVRRLALGADLICIDPVLPSDFRKHATVHLISELSTHPVIATAVEQMLRSVAERGTGLAINLSGPVVIHPGAGSPAKCWPLDRYRALAEAVTASGREVQLIAGEVEIDRWPSGDLSAAMRPATLAELWNVLKNASCFIGNDSGPAHLAGIIGLPTVTIFSPTDPAVWKPLGPRVKTVFSSDISSITFDDVLQLI